MQNKEVRVDLKVSRKESGLLQSDLAQLLGTTQPRISRLEKGKSVLTVDETVKLAIIFNENITKLFRLLSARMKAEIAGQLEGVTKEGSSHTDAELRQATLNRLNQNLSDLIPSPYER